MTELVKPLPKLKKKLLTTQQSQRPSNRLGQAGEQKAAHYLKQAGYRILDINVRYGNLEVDIIALDLEFNELVFVEVKTRSRSFFGNPSDAVNPRKLLNMAQVARVYRAEKNIWLNFRFDVMAILPGSVAHFKNVSW